MSDGLTRTILEERDNIENQRNRELNSNRETYIKQLEQENKELKERINTYENPEDLTLMCMYCDEKAKDKIKELKEENFKLQARSDRFINYWNKLKEWLEEGKKVSSERDNRIGYNFTTLVLDKMQEIEGGMNE